MSISSRLTRARERLRAVLAAAARRQGVFVACVAVAGIQAADAAALAGGRFVEADGWKARITIDCLLKDKVCGSFRYETLACEGDLIYSGETATGFEFRTELRAGRCLPGCVLHNQYGPSETHVVIAWTLQGDPAEWPESFPREFPEAAVRA